MLGHAPVLIVEDDPLLAFEVQAAVEDAGGGVVGPLASAEAALETLKSVVVAGAILEIDLAGGNVTVIAEDLVKRRIPMVFQSASDPPPQLRRLCPDAAFFKRPAAPRLLVDKLAELIRPQDWT